jgi:hypothetical protein
MFENFLLKECEKGNQFPTFNIAEKLVDSKDSENPNIDA